MYLTQKNQIRGLTAKEFEALKELCRLSKNLYNVGLYTVRQYYFQERKHLKYESNYHHCKGNENYQNYAQQRVEIAQVFVDALEDAVYRIREAPNRWSIIDKDVRRCLTRRFPYAILYTIEQDYILILAVMYCGRKPGYWKKRQ